MVRRTKSSKKTPHRPPKCRRLDPIKEERKPSCDENVPSENKDPFELLPPPDKPPGDPKDYRLIRLTNNGARILLISEKTPEKSGPRLLLPYVSDSNSTFVGLQSDLTGGQGENKRLQDSCFNCESLGFSKPESGENDESKEGEPSLDHSSSGNSEGVAIAVVVGSGFVDEPPGEFGGLAHFCEHLVFLGSGKFPGEDHFMTLIKEKGGILNASTMAESTVYFYEVKKEFLNETLEVFTGFFVDPLFRMDAIKREVNVIDHEFRMKRQSDMLIRMEILKDTIKSNHPLRNFSWGNKESLAGDESEEHYDRLRCALLTFHQTHYIGPNITVAIQGQMSLDNQQEMAIRHFTRLRPGKLSKEIPKKLKDPYNTPAFKKKYLVKPVGALEFIYMTWNVPKKFWSDYESKPLAYLSSAISSEISGGLVDYLKKKRWIMDLWCGLQFQSRTKYGTLFVIKMIITCEGYQNQENIIEAVFGYLEALRDDGPNNVIFENLQEVRDFHLTHYSNSRPALWNVKKLASSLHLYPSKDIIGGDTKLYKFNPDIIDDLLDIVTVKNFNVMIFANGDEANRCDRKECRTECPYTVQPFDKRSLCLWSKTKLWTSFHTPTKPNPYKICQSPLNHRGAPFNIIPFVESEKLTVMFVPMELEFPFAAYRLVIQSKGGRVTGIKQAMLNLLSMMLKFQLRQDIGLSQDAGITSSIEPGNGNIQISVFGKDKVGLKLMQQIATKIAKLTCSLDKNYFETSKEFLLKIIHLLLLQPFTLAFDLFNRLKYWGEQSLLAMHTALVNIQFEDFKAFTNDFMKELKIYMMVIGNITKPEVQSIVDGLVKIPYENIKDYSPFYIDRKRLVQLPNMQLNWRVENFNSQASTSFIINYYQIKNGRTESKTVTQHLLAGFLIQMMNQPFFSQLRTEKSLGYQVMCGLNVDNGILGILFLVCSDADKFSMDAVSQEIDSFIQRFYDERLCTLTDDQLNIIKEKYPGYKLVNFTADQIKQFYENFLLPTGKHFAKASVQVTGHSSKDESSGCPTSDDKTPEKCAYKEVMQLKTAQARVDQSTTGNVYFVQNVDLLHLLMNLYGL